MEKLKMLTPDLVKNNIEKIKKIFPDCITEHIRGGELGLLLILINCDSNFPVVLSKVMRNVTSLLGLERNSPLLLPMLLSARHCARAVRKVWTSTILKIST